MKQGDIYKVDRLPSIAGVRAMHALENRPKITANDTVPTTSFTAIIDSTITPVPMVNAVPRLSAPNLCAIAGSIVRPKKLEVLRVES